jgi:hypothetical protein
MPLGIKAVFWRFQLFPGRSKLLKIRGLLWTYIPERASKSAKLTVPPLQWADPAR